MNQDLNIPIDIVRSVIVIAETGSISKAAERLSLSQPALSSQIKRIQGILGCELFTRTANGSVVTEVGKLFLEQARRIIEANDQILRIGGRTLRQEPVRLGVNNLYVKEIFKCLSAEALSNVIIQGGNATEIAKGLTDGYIDIGVFFATAELADQVANIVVNEEEEQFVWVRSKNFVLSPGAPIPLLSHPRNTTDTLMIRALTKKGIPYRIAFNSADNLARTAAAEAGIGVTVFPARVDPAPLVRAREYYLPELPPLKVLLCARQSFHDGASLLKALSAQFFGKPAANSGPVAAVASA